MQSSGAVDALAASWHGRAAQQDNARARYNLGILYRDGRGVARDDEQAVHWFRRAAEQGHDFAQVNLGFLYDRGRGMPQDDAEALRWYRRAAEQGHAQAQSTWASCTWKAVACTGISCKRPGGTVFPAAQGHAEARQLVGDDGC